MKTFLFSIDFEEFYAAERQDTFRRTPLPLLADRLLDFLRAAGMRCTFFIVGEIALRFPDAIRSIAAAGHELACHTHTHRPLDEHTPASLRDDLLRNLDAIRPFAAAPVIGFRAPVLSLTARAAWAHEVLAGLGFKYSSSVLPATNPLYGWPGFGPAPRLVNGITEVPVTLASFGPLRLPIGAGTYFRCLPMPCIRSAFEAAARRDAPIVGYFHPYDIDTAQERVMSRGVNGSRFMNSLLYLNRSRTLERLESLLRAGFKIIPYSDIHGH